MAGVPLGVFSLMLRCFLTEYPGRDMHLVRELLRLAVPSTLDWG